MKFAEIPGKDFKMQVTQVTQKEWESVMGYNPSHFKGENFPVEMVSWDDCQEFINKLNNKKDGYDYCLPSEKEWEYCAGPCDKQDILKIAWCWENSNRITHQVGLKLPNELGLYDMLGNVWEWTSSVAEVAGSARVLRGGGCYNDARDLRSALLHNVAPGFRYINVGFRLVRSKQQ